MSNTNSKNKKVIHLTTSETLRLNEEVYSHQPKYPTVNKKLPQPNSSFQITSILNRSGDLEYESADDLDESHTDEASSRITDNETSSYSEDYEIPAQTEIKIDTGNKQIDSNLFVPKPKPSVSMNAKDVVVEEIMDTNKNSLGVVTRIGRFQVVKLDELVPLQKGRWTCYDYDDNKIETVDHAEIFQEANGFFNNNSFKLNYSFYGSLVMANWKQIKMSNYFPLADDNLIFAQSSMPKLCVDSNSNNTVKAVSSFHNYMDSNQNLKIDPNNSTISFKQVAKFTPESNPGNNQLSNNNSLSASVACSTSIDTKIEQALDVVKTHLRQTVRMEVEELKVKINELVERISLLEYENDVLRANVSPDVLATLGNKKN